MSRNTSSSPAGEALETIVQQNVLSAGVFVHRSLMRTAADWTVCCTRLTPLLFEVMAHLGEGVAAVAESSLRFDRHLGE